MPNAVVVYGIGEIGSLVARGALSAGVTVVPIVRETDRGAAFAGVHAFTPVVLAVPESALEAAVRDVPPDRRGDLVFVQNEIFPQTTHALGLDRPTVATLWVLRKRGLPALGARPSTVSGPHAAAMAKFLGKAGVAAVAVDERTALVDVVLKYAFIVAANALGVRGEGTLGEWLAHDAALVDALLTEGVALGSAHAGHAVDVNTLVVDARDAVRAFSAMPARGRTARERVERAVRSAAELGVRAPTLRASLDVT